MSRKRDPFTPEEAARARFRSDMRLRAQARRRQEASLADEPKRRKAKVVEKRRPRNAAEAREWQKQFAKDLRDNQAKPDEVPLNPDLVTWFADAVDAYEKPTKPTKKTKRRERSMDVELGLNPRPGRKKGTQMGGARTAIDVHDRRARKESWKKISGDLGIGVRSLQRTYARHIDKVAEHILQRSARSVPFGHDLKDGKLVINKREAATLRMIFECYAAQLGVLGYDLKDGKLVINKREAATAAAAKRALATLARKLEAKGITDKRGKPIDIDKVLNNRVYIGEVVPKGRYSGKHRAIVDRVLWHRAHSVRRVLMAAAARRKRGRKFLNN